MFSRYILFQVFCLGNLLINVSKFPSALRCRITFIMVYTVCSAVPAPFFTARHKGLQKYTLCKNITPMWCAIECKYDGQEQSSWSIVLVLCSHFAIRHHYPFYSQYQQAYNLSREVEKQIFIISVQESKELGKFSSDHRGK